LLTLRGCARIRGAGRLILIGLLGRLARLLFRLPLLALLTGLPSRLLLLALLTLLTWLTLLALLILLSGLRLSLRILLSLLTLLPLLPLLALLTLLFLLALLSRLALVLVLLRPQLRGDKITIMQGVPMQTRVPRSFLQGRLKSFVRALEIPRTGQRGAAIIGGFRILQPLELLGGGGVVLGLHLGMGTLTRIFE